MLPGKKCPWFPSDETGAAITVHRRGSGDQSARVALNCQNDFAPSIRNRGALQEGRASGRPGPQARGGLSGTLPPPLTREGRAVWVWRFPRLRDLSQAALTVTAGERAGVPRRGSQAPSDRAPRHLRGGLPSGRHPVQPSRRTPFPSPCLIAPDTGSQTDPSPENRLHGCRAALETP